MLTVSQAYEAVIARASRLPARRVRVDEALGLTLAEAVTADRDLPPWDKALLDGFAVRAADFSGPGPRWELEIVEEITAGQTPSKPIGPGQCAGIMTGAPMPEGADAVVMIEDARRDGNRVVVEPRKPIEPGSGRLERGREMKSGETLLKPGDRLGPVALGLLASVGCVQPLVYSRPVVAVASTGDEIVPAERAPGPGQIRNSNATTLEALAQSVGSLVELLPIAPDEPGPLEDCFGHGLEADVLLITGGVSAGKRDLVPEVLKELGVEAVFHKVRLKPGKPLLFGVGPAREGDRSGTLVFGLPGNPVSGIVGFLLFVEPALRAIRGEPAQPPRTIEARLTRPFTHRGDRPTYYPCRLTTSNGQPVVETLDWAGSADLRTVAEADGFAVFEAGEHAYEPGANVRFLPLPRG